MLSSVVHLRGQPKGTTSAMQIHRLDVSMMNTTVTYWETSKARLRDHANELGVDPASIQTLPCPNRAHEWVAFLNKHCGDQHG